MNHVLTTFKKKSVAAVACLSDRGNLNSRFKVSITCAFTHFTLPLNQHSRSYIMTQLACDFKMPCRLEAVPFV